MVVPLTPVIRNSIFACCVILPVAAAAAAYPYKKKNYSYIGVIAGLLAIAGIGVILFHLNG